MIHQFQLCRTAGERALAKIFVTELPVANAEVQLLQEILREMAENMRESEPHNFNENFPTNILKKSTIISYWNLSWDALFKNLKSKNEAEVLAELTFYNNKTVEMLEILERFKNIVRSPTENFAENSSPVCFANSSEVRDEYK